MRGLTPAAAGRRLASIRWGPISKSTRRTTMTFPQKLGLLAIPCLAAFFVWPHYTWLIYLGGVFAVIGFAGNASYVWRGNRGGLRRWRNPGRIDGAFIEDPPKPKE